MYPIIILSSLNVSQILRRISLFLTGHSYLTFSRNCHELQDFMVAMYQIVLTMKCASLSQHWPTIFLLCVTDETIEPSLVSTAPAAVNSGSRDKDTKDNNNNTSIANETNLRSAALERAYVHDVYENCEEPVGSIRPKVAQFLTNLDSGSLVCDVGCGNGRYLTAACNPAIYSIGVDRCFRLSKVARSSGSEVSSILMKY